MSDWAIRDLPRPCAFIQWKGTEVCADYWCLCGNSFHLDAEFAYAVECPYCNRKYEVSSMIELREFRPEELSEWPANNAVLGEITDDEHLAQN